MSQSATLLLSGRYLLPTHRQSDVIDHGAIALADDIIIDIGPTDSLVARYPEADQLHEEHGLIMPGLVNAHTHAAMACFRGLADDLPLMTWLQEHIFPVESKLTSEMVYTSTLLSLAEMIKSGTTSFCDMYLFAQDVARATEHAGMRGWIGEVLYDFPSPCYGELENGFSYVRDMFAHYKNHPLVTATVDPHSVYTCSPDLLQRTSALADEFDALYHIHLSENDAEVQGCLDTYGKTPVNHLHALGVLNERTLAAHCVVLDDAEMQLLSDNGVNVAHCPESNMKLASGAAPASQLLHRGATLALGTDGSASNNDVDMFSEMNSAAKLHKVQEMNPTAMNAETTLHASTMGGAHALQAEKRIGTLAPGKKADIIVLDMHQPHLTPVYNIPSHLVYAVRGGDVVHSVINGRLVMRNRELLTLDEQQILADVQELSKTILRFRDS